MAAELATFSELLVTATLESVAVEVLALFLSKDELFFNSDFDEETFLFVFALEENREEDSL